MALKSDILRDTDTFYDIESLHDIFTQVTFTPGFNMINIFIHTEPGSNAEKFMQQPNAEDLVLKRIEEVNHLYLTQNDIQLKINNLDKWSYQMRKDLMNETFQARMFGFNSHHYDEPMLAYLIYNTSKDDNIINLPKPSELRKFSDSLINGNNRYDAFGKDYMLKSFFQNNMLWTDDNKFIDIKDLNEKMRYTSLKRLSAQAGLTIKESSKLSGDNAYMTSLDDIAELLAYNTVDTINTYRIFTFNEYLAPFTQRSDLLERFKENYNGRLSSDSTSAKFIERVIVPVKGTHETEEALTDNDTINVFYPININHNESLINALNHIQENKLDEKQANQYLIDIFDLNENTPRYRYNKERHHIEEDLLEMAKEDYDFPENIYEMYKHVRGCKNLDEAKTKLYDLNLIEKVNGSLSISKNAFVRNSNSYITYSIGGCHGEYADREAYIKYYNEKMKENKEVISFNETLQLLQTDFGNEKTNATEYLMTKKNKTTPSKFEHLKHKDFVTGSYKNGAKWKQPKKEKTSIQINKEMKKFAKTVYGENIGHGDVDSLYPTLMKNLGMFSKVLKDGTIHDPYSELLEERLALKEKLGQVPKHEWTDKEKDMDRLQKLNKLLLNAASGVADASFKNNIRVNNKTTGMRICGQIILSCLVFKLTDAGSTALSTNTDGVYFTPLDEDTTKEIFETWCDYFNINATPEIIDLFVSKDSNNRLEVNDGFIEGAAGSTISLYKGTTLSSSINNPIIRDNALLDYLKNYKNPLESFDRDYIKERIQNIIAWGKGNDVSKTLELFQWFFVSNPSKNSFMTPIDINTNEIIEPGKTYRGFIVKESNVNMRKLTLTKENKNTDETAKAVAEKNHLINEKNKKNHIKFNKVTNLPEDNRVEIHQESLDEIPASILDNLDLDVYIDVIEASWHTWADNHVVINK